jgi:hypothetical protein
VHHDRPTLLYRLYNVGSELIYVGISKSPRRIGDHQRKPWWPEVARIEAEQHPDHESARTEEIRVIRTDLPRYNDCTIARAERTRRGIPNPPAPLTTADEPPSTPPPAPADPPVIGRIIREWPAPPVPVIGDYVVPDEEIGYPIRNYSHHRPLGDGLVACTRLEADGVWRTRVRAHCC